MVETSRRFCCKKVNLTEDIRNVTVWWRRKHDMQQTILLCLGKVIKVTLVSSPRIFSVSSFSQASGLGVVKKSSSLVVSAKLSA